MKDRKEKAKELVEKYSNYTSGWTTISKPLDYPSAQFEGNSMRLGRAKQCALIAVGEIIKQLSNLHKPEYVTFYKDDLCEQMDAFEKKDFWQQVKQEIEKL